MKTKHLHFAPNLVPLVLNGTKTTTWRLWDDKDLAVGDVLEMLEAGTKRSFATAKIVKVEFTTFGKLWKESWDGHEKYKSEQEMYDTYRGYYNREVGSDTVVKVIRFNLDSRAGNTPSVPARKFSNAEKKQWMNGIMDIYRRVRERAKDGPYEAALDGVALTVLPNVYPPTAFTDTLWFAKQLRELVVEKTLLEMGTGTGAIAILCAKQGARVVATDVNPDAVRNARMNVERYQLPVSVREGNLFEPLQPDEKFDCIFWSHPFNNWETPVEDMLLRSGLDYRYKGLRGYVAGARAHLKPNGRLLLGTGDSADLRTIAAIAADNGYALKLLKETTMPLEDGGAATITYLLYELKSKQ